MTLVREQLAKAQESAVHLEMRDAYMLDDPEFIRWQAGHREDPARRADWWNSWHDATATAAERGVALRRARVVSEPISPYVRYEYDITFMNEAAGEAVRWLPRHRAARLLLPGADYWLFDGTTVLFNHFTGKGQWREPGGMELVTDLDAAAGCAEAFEAVWRLATPHAEYRPV